jgi:hypothetical protein
VDVVAATLVWSFDGSDPDFLRGSWRVIHGSTGFFDVPVCAAGDGGA